MKPNLAKYRNKKICIAVSGGRDSMALLHFFKENGGQYGISVCAVNCDHMIRGEISADDSRFVKSVCEEWGIPLEFYKADCASLATEQGVGVETFSREWRRACYFNAKEKFKADAVATAHHMNDNAETVLFNLARGAALSGVTGICDGVATVNADLYNRLFGGNAKPLNRDMRFEIIRPLIECTRGEIDDYIKENAIPFVEDETNVGDDYTRNYIRHNVIPQLECAVPAAVKSIYRFSRLAAEDERYFEALIEEKKLINPTIYGVEINFCKEKPVFMRAAVKALKILKADIKDYTSGHMESLYNLQFAESGKKFEFLNFIAFAEGTKISICPADMQELNGSEAVLLENFTSCGQEEYCGNYLKICAEKSFKDDCEMRGMKILRFDCGKIPDGAAVRFMRSGDKFTKFGGGTKKLGDYFTDKKIPLRIRRRIPLVADGNDILVICGVEISDKVKICDKTETVMRVICTDYAHLSGENDQ